MVLGIVGIVGDHFESKRRGRGIGGDTTGLLVGN